MVNPFAGEVELVLDGKPHNLRLTLGALAELEAGLDGETVLDLVTRLESGQIASRDVLAIIVAGLRGGGWTGNAADLMTVEIAGGMPACARAAALALARAFAAP
ncbi:gene transfer agent family protein [Roseinatronobacter sp.]|uniref:gene transfer agent family protein n=1 Tax=Roseinatronobacter sp. TaxID=1945755 RepID=UPI0025ECDF40|nr:gene transfer agent family protein [Roseibaca sp.]